MGIKKKILDAMDIFLGILREKTLQTLEEVDASTTDGYWAGAGAVAELNNKLVFPDGTEFYLDVQNGIRGFNTSATRGADTFNPFSAWKINCTIAYKIINVYVGNTVVDSSVSGYIVVCGSKYKVSGLNHPGYAYNTGGANTVRYYMDLSITSIEAVNPSDYFS